MVTFALAAIVSGCGSPPETPAQQGKSDFLSLEPDVKGNSTSKNDLEWYIDTWTGNTADYGTDIPGNITVTVKDATKEDYIIDWKLPDKSGVSANGKTADLKFELFDKAGQFESKNIDASDFMDAMDSDQIQ